MSMNLHSNGINAQAVQWDITNPEVVGQVIIWMNQLGLIDLVHFVPGSLNGSITLEGCRMDNGNYFVKLPNRYKVYLNYADLMHDFHVV